MTQFKDKGSGNETVRAGLFTYPVLMAADILLYDAEAVPVGDDQRQHLELAREVAVRFNNRYGETFTVPEAAIPGAARPGDGPPAPRAQDVQVGRLAPRHHPAARLREEITRKVRRAVTDTDGEVRYDRAAKPGLANLLELLAAATGRTPVEVAAGYYPLRRPQEGRGRRAERAPAPGARASAELEGDPSYVGSVLAAGRPMPTGWPRSPTPGRRTPSGLPPSRPDQPNADPGMQHADDHQRVEVVEQPRDRRAVRVQDEVQRARAP